MNNLKFAAAASYRVLVDSVAVSQPGDLTTALNEGAALAVSSPASVVEIVGGNGVRILASDIVSPPAENPCEQEYCDCMDDDDPIIPPAPELFGDHPFFQGLESLLPGQFDRPMVCTFPDGVSNQRRMHNTNWLVGGGGTIGRGWTGRSILDPLTGRSYEIYCREQYPTSIIWMEADGRWYGIPAPDAAGIGGRRPFERLSRLGEYLYFLPSSPRPEVGRLTRCHVTRPDAWEDAGAPVLPISVASGFNGDCSLTVNESSETFIVNLYGTGNASTKLDPDAIWEFQSGRVFAWSLGDVAWSLLGRTQSSGRVGMAIYNAVHREVLLWGGSTQYDHSHQRGGECLATVDADNVLHRHGPCGLFASADKRRLGVCGKSGDYVLLDRLVDPETKRDDHDGPIRIWIGDPTRGREFRLMHLLPRSETFSRWEQWHPPITLPGLDVIVWMDLENGPLRHRLIAWEDLEGAEFIPIPMRGTDQVDPPVTEPPATEPPETNPPVVEIPDSAQPPPPVDDMELTRLAEIGRSLAPGGLALLDPSYQDGDEWSRFRGRNTFAPAVSLPADMTTWGGKGFFDRVRGEVLVLGDRTPLDAPAPRLSFHAYSVGAHAFRHLDLSTLLLPLATHRANDPGKAHPYGQMAMDDVRRHFYYGSLTDQIRRFLLDAGEWEILPVVSNGAAFVGQCPMEIHSGMGMLLTLDSAEKSVGTSRLRGWADGDAGWRDVALAGHSGYQASSRYSRIRGDMLIIGGNHNPGAVTLITATGEVEHRAPKPASVDGIPLVFGVQARNLSDCPITGDYRLLDSTQRVLFGYAPGRDEWYIAQSWIGAPTGVWPGPYEGHLLVPIAGTELSVWCSRHAPRIYRHAR